MQRVPNEFGNPKYEPSLQQLVFNGLDSINFTATPWVMDNRGIGYHCVEDTR